MVVQAFVRVTQYCLFIYIHTHSAVLCEEVAHLRDGSKVEDINVVLDGYLDLGEGGCLQHGPARDDEKEGGGGLVWHQRRLHLQWSLGSYAKTETETHTQCHEQFAATWSPILPTIIHFYVPVLVQLYGEVPHRLQCSVSEGHFGIHGSIAPDTATHYLQPLRVGSR